MTAQLDGAARIAAERARQVTAEGYAAEHDDLHTTGSLALAAALYAAPCALYEQIVYQDGVRFRDPWPWDPCSDKRPRKRNALQDNHTLPQEERIRQLVKAGALIAAEIDRLERRARPKEGETHG